MSTHLRPGLVLGFPDDAGQAQRFAAAAGIDYAAVDVHGFPDGESRVRLPAALPSAVVLYCSLNEPNRRLIELELTAATALELGASRLVLVAPYLGYMRQDAAFQPGEAVSQRIVGALLARRFDTVITVDPHLHRTAALADAVPARRAIALTAAPVMAEWLAARGDDALLLGPDEESEQWVSAIGKLAGRDYAVASKSRLGDRRVVVELPNRDFAGRSVVIVDDVASTGRTLAAAARQLAERGAAATSVLVTHALFIGDALAALEDAGVGDVASTDSIAHPTNRLRLDALLAAALADA